MCPNMKSPNEDSHTFKKSWWHKQKTTCRVIELKPEKSETPESGFEHPENKIQETSLEMYDGFIEYMITFLNNKVSQDIVLDCQKRLNQMKNELENNDYETYDENLNIHQKISPEKINNKIYK